MRSIRRKQKWYFILHCINTHFCLLDTILCQDISSRYLDLQRMEIRRNRISSIVRQTNKSKCIRSLEKSRRCRRNGYLRKWTRSNGKFCLSKTTKCISCRERINTYLGKETFWERRITILEDDTRQNRLFRNTIRNVENERILERNKSSCSFLYGCTESYTCYRSHRNCRNIFGVNTRRYIEVFICDSQIQYIRFD